MMVPQCSRRYQEWLQGEQMAVLLNAIERIPWRQMPQDCAPST